MPTLQPKPKIVWHSKSVTSRVQLTGHNIPVVFQL